MPNSSTQSENAARRDAITLLKADHRQVETWFEEYEGAVSELERGELALKICDALTVHATIEEEIFYPAFLEATGNEDIHHEAEVEHEGAKHLIAQIEASDPSDEYFDAKVRVLSEMIRHHVKEEERSDGMFDEARDSEMDLEEVGAQLQARKEELTEAMASSAAQLLSALRSADSSRSART